MPKKQKKNKFIKLTVRGEASFPKLFNPMYSEANNNHWWSIMVKVPKSDKKQLKEIADAFSTTLDSANLDEYSRDELKKKIKFKKFQDGDKKPASEYEENHGYYILNLTSSKQPVAGVLDENKVVHPVKSDNDINFGDMVEVECAIGYIGARNLVYCGFNSVIALSEGEMTKTIKEGASLEGLAKKKGWKVATKEATYAGKKSEKALKKEEGKGQKEEKVAPSYEEESSSSNDEDDDDFF